MLLAREQNEEYSFPGKIFPYTFSFSYPYSKKMKLAFSYSFSYTENEYGYENASAGSVFFKTLPPTTQINFIISTLAYEAHGFVKDLFV